MQVYRKPVPASWPHPCVLQHQNGEGWALETPEEVRSFLQHWAVKVFPRGSKAFVRPPLFIKFDNLKDRVKVSFIVRFTMSVALCSGHLHLSNKRIEAKRLN